MSESEDQILNVQTGRPQVAHKGPLQEIPIEVIISVGKARPLISELLNLSQSAILPLDRRIDDPVELYVGDKLIARGDLQELEGAEQGQLAVRLTEVISDTRDLG